MLSPNVSEILSQLFVFVLSDLKKININSLFIQIIYFNPIQRCCHVKHFQYTPIQSACKNIQKIVIIDLIKIKPNNMLIIKGSSSRIASSIDPTPKKRNSKIHHKKNETIDNSTFNVYHQPTIIKSYFHQFPYSQTLKRQSGFSSHRPQKTVQNQNKWKLSVNREIVIKRIKQKIEETMSYSTMNAENNNKHSLKTSKDIKTKPNKYIFHMNRTFRQPTFFLVSKQSQYKTESMFPQYTRNIIKPCNVVKASFSKRPASTRPHDRQNLIHTAQEKPNHSRKISTNIKINTHNYFDESVKTVEPWNNNEESLELFSEHM